MKKEICLLLAFLAVSFFLVMLAKSERLRGTDNYLSDALYQQAMAVDGNIIIIAVDEKALACYGPYQDWNRAKAPMGYLRGVHSAAVFRSLQDREPLEIHMGRSLKYRCKICC